MGERFLELPRPVREMHTVIGDGGATGAADVSRGKSALARAIADLMGFPTAGQHKVHVSFFERDGREIWVRDFSGRCFRSELSTSGTMLVERFGPLRFVFELHGSAEGLEMAMRAWSVLRISLPMWLAPRSVAREWAHGDTFVFDVSISLPLIGMIVHYQGELRRL